MIHAIYIYIILNALVTGFYINEGDLSDYTLKGKIGLFLFWVLLLSIGSILLVIQILINIFKYIFKSINEYFQISFFYMYYFTKEFDTLSIDQLKRMNKITVNNHSSNTKRDKIWKYTMDMINKKYNYDTNQDITEF